MASLRPSPLSYLNSAALFPSQNRRRSSTFHVSCCSDDRAKLAIERAKAYKEAKESGNKPNPACWGSNDDKARLAIERAKAYKEALKSKNKPNTGLEKKSEKKEEPKELTVSSIDFLGLGFAEKKNYEGLPPGLRPIVDPYSEDDFPEVEIIVGDPSKFINGKISVSKPQTSEVRQGTEEDGSEELYRPKVTTWGASNISRTFDDGRNIQPGDVLETEEEKASKEECSEKLLTVHKMKIGSDVDPKVGAECAKVGRGEQKKEERKELTVSSVDFLGLGFADKKNYMGLPPGLRPIVDPYSEDDFPEVVIIVGDPSKFKGGKTSESKPQMAEVRQGTEEDGSEELYRPKVTAGGANNLSKMFGGGRNIQPGDVLEKAAKEER